MVSLKAKFSIFAATTALGITAFSVNPTQAAVFSLKFSSNSGEGQGTFTSSYLSENELAQFGGGEDSGLVIGTIKNWLYIKSFQATLPGFSWNSSTSNFWDPQSNTFKHIAFSEQGKAYIVDEGVFKSENDVTKPTLILSENSIYQILMADGSLDGKWAADRVDEMISQTSDAVPEAPTILGSLSSIAMLTLFKRAISKKTKS